MSETKPTNPKDKIGSGKLPLHLWPTTATVAGTVGLLNGALKYGSQNWRAGGVRTSIYIDALLRHAFAYYEGEDVDPDDGVEHESAMLACLAIIVDAKAQGMLIDDRAYGGPQGYRQAIDKATAHVKRLKELHAGKDPHHWTIADNPLNEMEQRLRDLSKPLPEYLRTVNDRENRSGPSDCPCETDPTGVRCGDD